MACGAENESDCPPAVSLACQWGGVKIFHAGQATADNTGVGDLQGYQDGSQQQATKMDQSYGKDKYSDDCFNIAVTEHLHVCLCYTSTSAESVMLEMYCKTKEIIIVYFCFHFNEVSLVP